VLYTEVLTDQVQGRLKQDEKYQTRANNAQNWKVKVNKNTAEHLHFMKIILNFAAKPAESSFE